MRKYNPGPLSTVGCFIGVSSLLVGDGIAIFVKSLGAEATGSIIHQYAFPALFLTAVALFLADGLISMFRQTVR